MKPTSLERLRSAMHRKQSHSKDTPQVLKRSKLCGQVPAEILDIIQDELPMIDQICLAFSCKQLYAHFVSFIKSNDETPLKLLCPRKQRVPLYRNTELNEYPRIQLLRRLENTRWKYCVECMVLHPRSAWKPPKQFNTKCHCYGCSVLYRRQCMPFAGMVDICPCLSIAFNERQLVISRITTSTYNAEGRFFDGNFSHALTYDDILSHECEVSSHPCAEVKIITDLYMGRPTLSLSRAKKSLYVRNCYTFNFSQNLLGRQSSICPHKEPNRWLKEFFLCAGSDYSAWHGKATAKVTEPNLLKVVTVRELGYQDWNKRGWKSNRSDYHSPRLRG